MKRDKFTKRVMASVLALIMLLGLLPTNLFVSADETTGAVELSAWISSKTVTESQLPEETPEPTETQAPEETPEPTETQAPEETSGSEETQAPEETSESAEMQMSEETSGSGETQTPEETSKYEYTVHVQSGETEITADQFEVNWGDGSNNATWTSEATKVTAEVHYDGLILSVSEENSEKNPLVAEFSKIDAASGTIYIDNGYDHTLMLSYQLPGTIALDGASVEAKTESNSITINGLTVELKEEAKVGEQKVTLELKGEGGTVYAEQNYTVSIENATSMTFDSDPGEGWVNQETTLTVTHVKPNADAAAPVITVTNNQTTDDQTAVEFSKEDGLILTAAIKFGGNKTDTESTTPTFADGDYTITCNGQVKTIKIDTQRPKGEIKTFAITDGKTEATITATDKTSGVASVSVQFSNDKENWADATECGQTGDVWKASIDGKYLYIKFSVKDHAGNGYDSEDGKPALDYEVNGLPTESGYYNQSFSCSITVDNADGFDAANSYIKLNDEECKDWTVDTENSTATIRFALTDSDEATGIHTDKLTSLAIHAVTTDGRSLDKTLWDNGEVVVDTTPPELILSATYEGEEGEAVQANIKTWNGKLFLEVPGVTNNGAEDGEVVITVKGEVDDQNFAADGYDASNDHLNGFTMKEPTNGENVTFSYTVTCEDGKVTEVPLPAGSFKDKAGNPMEKACFEGKTDAEGNTNMESLNVSPDGMLEAAIYVDRKSPNNGDTESPTIGLTDKESNKQYEGVYYSNEIAFEVSVDDEDSGIRSVFYWVKDAGEAIAITDGEEVNITDSRTITLKVNEDKEQDNIELYVRATDNAGNSRTVRKTFDVDRKAPEITITRSDSPYVNVNEKDYFAVDVTFTIAVKDLHPGEQKITYTLNGEKKVSTEGELTLDLRGSADATTPGDILESLNVAAYDKIGEQLIDTDNAYNEHRNDETSAYPTTEVDAVNPEVTVTVGEKKDNKIPVTVEVKEINLNTVNSYVTYSLKDGTEEELKFEPVTEKQGVYSACFNLEPSENAGAHGDILTQMKIYAVDYAGRTAEGISCEDFSFNEDEQDGVWVADCNDLENDSTPPEIRITMPQQQENNDSNTYESVDYYSTSQKVIIEVTDVNFDAKNSTISYTMSEVGEERQETTLSWQDAIDGKDGNITFDEKGKCVITVSDGYCFSEISIDAEDTFGNQRPATDTENVPFIVDETAPELYLYAEYQENNKTVTANIVDRAGTLFLAVPSVTDSEGQKDNTPVEITVNGVVVDKNFTLAGYSEAVNDQLEGFKMSANDGNVTFSYTFTCAAGVVTELPLPTGKFVDLANNLMETAYYGQVGADNLQRLAVNEEGKLAATIHIDRQAPEISISMPQQEKNTYEGVDYYSTSQEICIRVTDSNFDAENSTIFYTISNNGTTDTVTERAWNNAYTDSESGYSVAFTTEERDGMTANICTITVPDGYWFGKVSVCAKDVFDNQNTVSQSGDFIVDTKAPTAKISFSENVAGFYTNSNNPGVVYVQLDEPVKGDSDSNPTSGKDKETVTFTLTVSDKNLALKTKDEEKGVVYTGQENDWTRNGWKGEAKVNENSELTYTQEIEVVRDSTGNFALELHLEDLAGHKITAEDITVPDGFTLGAVDNGNISKIITVDRRRPSSEADNTPPVLNLTPSAAAKKTATGIDLFSSSFSYNIEVYDGDVTNEENGQYNSGLQSVTWTLSDSNGVVANKTQTASPSSNGVRYDWKEDVAVNISGGKGESNDVTLKVTVVDNVGNTITKTVNFGIDNLAPRVKVTYDNNSVQNDKYFKANRTATITVEDINFNSANTVVNTQVSPRWSGQTATCSYTVDGDYTFSMSTTDLAGNHTADGSVTYVGQAAKEFVIDKTAPVISVSFNNNNAQNGKYYNAGRVASITIKEHNFRAADVKSVITATNAGAGIATPSVSGWSRSGDTNGASVSFTRDGDYTMVLDYTDLAGNPAVTYTAQPFTVDTVAPEITFSLEDYSAYNGNVVPEVTITDINFNRSGYSIPVNFQGGLGQAMKEISLDASSSTIQNGVKVSFANVNKVRSNDGIYVMTATATDLAGNTYSNKITYSVNRFGSTYIAYDEQTRDLLSSGYANSAPTIRVQEINPNAIMNSSIVESVGGTTVTLKEGKDYTVERITGDDCWNGALYTINADLFMNGEQLIEGDYELTYYSEDKAANTNSNRYNQEEQRQLVRFTLDSTVPVITIAGVENGARIRAEMREITLYYSDSSGIQEIIVYLDGTEYMRLDAEMLAENPEYYVLQIAQSNKDRVLQVVIKDAAGNEYTSDELTFFLNGSAFQQYIHNLPLLVGSLAGLLLVIVLIFLVGKSRRKKKQAV